MPLSPLPLSPFDSLMPPRHTFRLFYFHVPPPTDPTTIVSHLKTGFEKMIQAIPHLAGTVITLPPTNEKDPKRGRLAIAAPFHSTAETFRIRDLRRRADIPSYEVLRDRGFPMDVFAFEDVFTVATDREDWFGLRNPVLVAQANLLEGGVVVAVGMHHAVLDGAAAVEVMRAWAGACRGEEVVGKEGDLSRRALVRGGGEEEGPSIEEFAEYIYRGEEEREGEQATTGGSGLGAASEAGAPPAPSVQNTLATSIFFFPYSRLLDLKTTLYPNTTSSPSYISTNDALSALCFACLTHARWPYLSFSEDINLALNLDGRRLLEPPLPDTWMGNAVLHAQIKYPLATLLPPCIKSLSDLALKLRNRILEMRGGGYAEGLLRALHKVPNLGKVVPSFQAAVGPGGKVCKGMLVGVSTARHEFFSLDWGFGKCERMRLPKQRFGVYGGASVILPRLGKADTETEIVAGDKKGELEGRSRGAGDARVGMCLMLPKLKKDGVEVLVGLNPEAMERLRADELWNRWARWTCD
ncbi:MAG: hypothetical protein Q9195_005954 [Heterodermia aff. obscurata]